MTTRMITYDDKLLKAMYELADGAMNVPVDCGEVGKRIGLEKEDVFKLALKLVVWDLVKVVSGDRIMLTAKGRSRGRRLIRP